MEAEGLHRRAPERVAMVAKPRKRTPRYRELSHEEGWQLLEETAQQYLGIGADEFVRKWRAGEFGDPDETNPDIWSVVFTLPFAGIDPRDVEPNSSRG